VQEQIIAAIGKVNTKKNVGEMKSDRSAQQRRQLWLLRYVLVRAHGLMRRQQFCTKSATLLLLSVNEKSRWRILSINLPLLTKSDGSASAIMATLPTAREVKEGLLDRNVTRQLPPACSVNVSYP
jgi:hypothetical protein